MKKLFPPRNFLPLILLMLFLSVFITKSLAQLSNIQSASGDVALQRQSQAVLKKTALSSGVKPIVTLSATPNPFTQSLTVSLKTTSPNSLNEPCYNLSIINTNGTKLFSKSIGHNSSMHIGTRNFVPGMYLVNVMGSNGTIYKTKVIKIN